MKLKEILQEVTKEKVYVRLIYTEPKEFSKHDYIDNDHAKSEMKKDIRDYGGKVIDTVKETTKDYTGKKRPGFTWLIEFKNRKEAQKYCNAFDDAGRTKLVRVIPNTKGKWWDPVKGA